MKRIVFILCLIVASVSGCLKETPKSSTTAQNYYRSVAQIRTGLNGCYQPLRSIYATRGFWFMTEVGTDLMFISGSTMYDANCDVSPAKPSVATTLWVNGYKGVMYTNEIIEDINYSIENGYVTKDEVQASIAEAVVLRAMYYYVLTCSFGDVPFYLDYVETDEDMIRIAKLGRMSAVETRNTLIEMLKLYVPTLPQIRTHDQPKNNCGAAMGWMMIAKLASWNKDWDTVIYACEHLDAIYGNLAQYPYSDVMFRNKNTPESIFEVNHEYVQAGIDYTTPSNLAISTVVLPYPRTSGTAIYDGVTIEELGNEGTVYTPLRPTSYMKNVVAPSGTGDIRRDYNMASGYDGVKFEGSSVWMGPKFWCPGLYKRHDSNNYKIFRYADAVLLHAEALCEKGDYVKSVEMLNMVRARAEVNPYSFQTEVKLRGEIRDERARELFGEFCRKYDLVRWGIWYDQMVAYCLYSNVQTNIRPCHEFYPIPDVQCERTERILDNPEYDKYNLTN